MSGSCQLFECCSRFDAKLDIINCLLVLHPCFWQLPRVCCNAGHSVVQNCTATLLLLAHPKALYALQICRLPFGMLACVSMEESYSCWHENGQQCTATKWMCWRWFKQSRKPSAQSINVALSRNECRLQFMLALDMEKRSTRSTLTQPRSA